MNQGGLKGNIGLQEGYFRAQNNFAKSDQYRQDYQVQRAEGWMETGRRAGNVIKQPYSSACPTDNPIFQQVTCGRKTYYFYHL